MSTSPGSPTIEDTVKGHFKIIFTKLGVSDRTQAVMLAMRRGIIAP